MAGSLQEPVMTKVTPASFSPELVAIMKAALDAAFIELTDYTEHLLPRRRWHSGLSVWHLKASQICTR
jgi:hypothetical protein